MKQVKLSRSRWAQALLTVASMLVFSVSLASSNTMTAPPAGAPPYAYTDPAAASFSYNNVGQPVEKEANSLILNNQTFGLSGPVTVSGGYSENFGYEMQAAFAHMFGFYDALSLLGAYAPQENRIDITWAHAWTENQRTKLSVERLAEQMDFNYDSGSATEWVPQYAYGAGYQYLFNQNWLKNVEISAYYAQAQSQDLATVQFEDSAGVYDNYRHIAGATSKGSAATLGVSPWATALVGLGLNYDSVNYATKYADTNAENSNGFGFTVSLEQLLSKHVKLGLSGSQREVYDSYSAGVSFLTPVNLEVGLTGQRTLGENGSSSDSRFNLNFSYFFDDKDRYQNGYRMSDVAQNDLAAWASKSLAYMNEVLAAADQKTVQVLTNPATTDQDNAPQPAQNDEAVINLTVGEVNHINIAAYIAKMNLTAAQQQATPTITGGPAEVEFTYDNAKQSLVTKTVVPASVAEKAVAPLVLVFPAQAPAATDSGLMKSAVADTLTFKVTVGAAGPTLNLNFMQAQTSVLSRAQTWVFHYDNLANPKGPADAMTMFLIDNASDQYLTMASGYPVISNDANHCYTVQANDTRTVQTLTVSSKGSEVCPGNATIKVKTKNSALNSPEQTITITAKPATSPFVSGGSVASPIGGQAYPAYTFSDAQVSPGEGQKFDTANGKNYLKVYDTSNGCTDVTASSNLLLELSDSNTQAVLLSKDAIPTNLEGHALNLYVHITNSVGDSADNGTTSNCGGTPFTTTVAGAPTIKSNIDLGAASVDASYTYNFSAGSDFTTGSSNLSSNSSYSMDVVNSDGSETPVTPDQLGLALDIGANSISMSGIAMATYAGDTVHVYLTLQNMEGYAANNNAAPATVKIIANPAQAPAVGGNSALTSVNQGQTYPGEGLSGTTAGSGRSYASVNTVSDSGTYVKVADASGNDVTALAQVNLSANGEVLTLQSTGGAVSNQLQGTYNVYVHVTNDAQVTASNCSVSDCSTLTGGAPYTLFVNNPPVINSNIDLGSATTGNAYNYDFVAQGTLSVGSTNLDPQASTVTMTLANGDEVTPSALGLTPVVTTNDVILSGTPNVGYEGQTIHVYLKLQDIAGFNVDNIDAPAVLTIAEIVNSPVVAGGQSLTVGTQYTSYNYAFPASGEAAVTPGENETFNTDSSVTYATVTDPSGVDQSGQFSLLFSADNTQISLTSNNNTLATQGVWTVALHVANVAGKVADNAANPDTFTVVANDAMIPQQGDVGHALTSAVVNQANSMPYNYTGYASTPMLAGPTGSNESFNTANTKALVYYVTDSTNSNPLPGFDLTYNADNTAIIGLTASAATVASLEQPVNVFYQAVNNDNPQQIVTSTVPDTIAIDMITVAEGSNLATATVATSYHYSLADNAQLTLGSTGMSAADSTVMMKMANGVIVTPAELGLTPVITTADVTLDGTAHAGYAGNITLELNLQTPDGLLIKTSNVNLPVSATIPSVNGGLKLPAVDLNHTYSYTFSNDPSQPGAVYAGAGESFSTDPTKTYATVTGKVNYEGVFSLTFNEDHTQITLTSGNNVLTAQDVLNVVLHVANVDDVAQNNVANPNIINVGSVAGYLFCPSSSVASPRPDSATSNLYNTANGGDILDKVTFNWQSRRGSGTIQLSGASINNGKLTCQYGAAGDGSTSPEYVTTANVPADAVGYTADWKGNSCALSSNITAATANKSCQITYKYQG